MVDGEKALRQLKELARMGGVKQMRLAAEEWGEVVLHFMDYGR